MKKLLLLSLALVVSAGVFAQERNFSSISKKVPRPLDAGNIIEPASNSYTNGDVSQIYKRSGTLSKTTVSTSLNVFGLVSTQQRVVSALPAANMVVFSNRAGGTMGATGNDIKVCYSNDLGVNWSNIVISPVSPNMFRYPSTIIYNPEGNTDPNNMFAIFSGPYTIPAGFKGQYYGSIGLDGLNKDVTYEVNEPSVYINHINMDLTVSPGGKVHVASSRLNGNATTYTNVGWEVLNGTFNTSTKKVDWELPRVLVQPQANDANRIDGDNMVYSPDGTVGYLFGTGADVDTEYNPYGVEWPIIYKTINNGQTWEKIAPFDFSQINTFKNILYPTSADLSVVIPRWYNKWVGATQNGATVDINGNLHIAGVVLGTLSLDPDSLNYFYNAEPRLMFDVSMNGDGNWNAQVVDTIRTEAVPQDLSADFTTGWDQRIKMNRTADGSKVFVTWGDTDPLLWTALAPTTNVLPDVYIWGYDIVNNRYTNPVNVTGLTDFWGDNFFMYSSDVVIEQGNDYLIPVSTSKGATENGPMINEYLSGPGFNIGDFVNVGIGEINKPASIFTINPAYPNPTTGLSFVTINLEKASALSLTVYNLTGQKLFEQKHANIAAGGHKFTIDCSGLKAGVYFYTVKAGDNSVTRKLVVK